LNDPAKVATMAPIGAFGMSTLDELRRRNCAMQDRITLS